MSRRWQPPYVDRSVPRALLRAARTPTERALVGCLYYAGLRVSEACNLRREDLDLAGRPPTVLVHGKGGKIARLPLASTLRGLLMDVLDTVVQHPRVFPSPRQPGRSISRSTAWRMLKTVAARSGLNPDNVWPHLLRHAFVSHLAEDPRNDMGRVRDLARHSNLATTSIYYQTNPARLAEALDSLETEDL